MTEAEWLSATEAWPMCLFLRDRMSDRKARLLACAYCRSLWSLMGKASRKAILLGEQMAEGSVVESQQEAVLRAAIEAVFRFSSMSGDHFMAADRAYRVACNDGWYAVEWTVGNGPELPGRVRFVHDIFGNPFPPVTIGPGLLTSEVVTLAQAIYEERAFDRMASLGMALADSGCTHPDILAHCREPGEHVRGCWAVDAILRKDSLLLQNGGAVWGRSQMKIHKIFSETIHGKKRTTNDYAPQGIEDVDKEIRELDGTRKSLVMFFVDEHTNLSVGGGNHNKYNVEVTCGISDAFFTLVDHHVRKGDADEIELVIGGQAAPFPRRQVVDSDTALQAATYWAKHGELDPSLLWEKH